jgi:hypothetical protein
VFNACQPNPVLDGSNDKERTTDAPGELLLEHAQSATAAGLCVIPISQDGSKRPGVPWKRFQDQRPTDNQLRRWFASARTTGLAVVCGKVSGNLEVLDIEDEESWAAYEELIEDAGLGLLWERVAAGYLEQAPNGGYHVLYRSETVGGNTPLARRPKRPEESVDGHDNVKVLIETRGEGGYAITAPSYGGVHPSGKPYVLVRGGFNTIATISADERDDLFTVARMLDEMPERKWVIKDPTAPYADGRERPGDRFNRETHWDELLYSRYGFANAGRPNGAGQGWRVRRPGKTDGISATVNYQGSNRLKMFSSSTPIPTEGTHSPFEVYAYMEHDGDFVAAAKTLARQQREHDRASGSAGGMTAPMTRQSARAGQFKMRVINMADVVPENVDWLWDKRIARGEFHIIGGYGGAGKGTITANIAAIGSRDGQEWPDGTRAPRFRTLFMATEDSPSHTLRPRLDLHGADPSQVGFLKGVEDDDGNEFFFNVDKHLDALNSAIVEEGFDLVVIDPLTTIMPGSDRNQEGDVRDKLTPLVNLAAERNVAILGIMHLGKPNGIRRTLTQQLLGASAFGNLARVVMMVAEIDSGERIFGVAKNNLAPITPALTWDRDEDRPVQWCGESTLTVEEMLHGARIVRRSSLETAEEFILDSLKGGMKLAVDIEREAKLHGISKSTLYRAKAAIGVDKWKEPVKDGPWYWLLPAGAPPAAAENPAVPEVQEGDDTAAGADRKILNPVQADLRIFATFAGNSSESDADDGDDFLQCGPGFGAVARTEQATRGVDDEDSQPGMYGIENLPQCPVQTLHLPPAHLADMVEELRQFTPEELHLYRSELETAADDNPATPDEFGALAYVERERSTRPTISQRAPADG